MAKIYVAGKTQDRARVRQVQNLVRHTGHEVTYDWTAIVEKHGGDSNEVPIAPELRRTYALNDLRGTYTADLLIACGHPNLCGTLWECGMAAAFSTPIWLLWWEECSRHSIFEDLPNVERLDVQTMGKRLWDISSKRLEPPTGTAEAMNKIVKEMSGAPKDPRTPLYFEERSLD